MGRTIRQLRLLMWKNLKITWRSKLWTVVEMATPLIFFILINFVASNAVKEEVASHTFPSLSLNGSVQDFDVEGCPMHCVNFGQRQYILLYSRSMDVSNSSVYTLLHKFEERFKNEKGVSVGVEYVEGIHEMERRLRNDIDETKLCQTKYIGGLLISVLSEEKRQLKYQLWMPFLSSSMKLSSEYALENSPFVYPPSDSRHQPSSLVPYCNVGLFPFQLALHSSFSQIMGQEVESSVITRAFAQPQHERSSIEALLEMSFPLFALMTFTMVLHTARDMASEKETGMKDFLQVMGMGRLVFFLSHILLSLAKATIAIVINCIPFFYALPNVNPFLILIAVFFYALCVISMAGVVAACVRSSNTAIKVCSLVIFMLVVGASVAPPRESLSPSFLASINPNTALGYAFKAIVEAVRRKENLGFLSMFNESTLVFSYGNALMMLIFDSCFYILVTLFLDWLFSSSDSPFTRVKNCIRRSPLNERTNEGQGMGVEEMDCALQRLEADIEVTDVSKVWVRGMCAAVDGFSVKAFRGQVTVLLGHNGAGKSTTFNMICGLTPPTEGSIKICGMDLREKLAECQDCIGYCPQGNPLFALLTVDEHLEFFALLKGRIEWKTERDYLLNALKLSEKRGTIASNLSGGMKRKLCVAMALIGNNEVVLLDEPTAGMDPGARKDIEGLLERYRHNSTILMTTHYTDEAEQLGERIIIMDKGRVACSGSAAFLKKNFGTGYILTLVSPREHFDSKPILAICHKYIPEAYLKGKHGMQIEICLPKEKANRFPEMLKELEREEKNGMISSFGLSLNTLEQVFLRVGELADPMGDSSCHIQSTLDDIINSERRITPSILSLLRIKGLILKKFLYQKAHLASLIPQFVVPIVLIICAANILRLLDFNSGQDRVLSLSSLPPTRFALFTKGISPDLDTKISAKLLLEKTVKEVRVSTSSSPDEWYVNERLERPPYVGGMHIDSNGTTLIHNEVLLHSLPSLITLLDSARYDVNISSTLHVYSSYIGESDVNTHSSSSIIKSALTGPVFVIIFSLITSPFITLPIVDRTSKFAHQQLLTGTSPLLYWGINFLFDFVLFIIGALLFTLVFYLCDWMVPFIGYMILLWLDTFFASIFIIYLASYLFSSPSKGQIILFIYQVLITLVAFIFTSLIDFGIIKGEMWTDILEGIILLSVPSFAFCRGGYTMAKFSMLPTEYVNLWDWDKLGRIFAYLFIMGCLSCALFCVLQLKRIRKMFYQVWMATGMYRIEDEEDSTVDDEVKREAARVKNMPTENFALTVRNLGKKYGKTVALRNLNVGVSPRECFGLLGVNGAGKTTTFSILTGESFASQGTAFIYGTSVENDTVRMGYCPQFDALLPELTGRQILEILAYLHGFIDAKRHVQLVLEAVGMKEHGDKKTSNYSGGQRRKLSVAASILTQNGLVILDEPTAGIDPKARRDIWTLLICVRDKSDSSLLLTSHSMDECEALCSRIAVLNKGRMAAIGTSQSLKTKYGNSYTLTIVIEDDIERSEVESMVDKFFPGASLKPTQSNTLVFEIDRTQCPEWSMAFERALDLSSKVGARDFCLSQSSLEHTFMQIALEQEC